MTCSFSKCGLPFCIVPKPRPTARPAPRVIVVRISVWFGTGMWAPPEYVWGGAESVN
jgi:hypothetical protein